MRKILKHIEERFIKSWGIECNPFGWNIQKYRTFIEQDICFYIKDRGLYTDTYPDKIYDCVLNIRMCADDIENSFVFI